MMYFSPPTSALPHTRPSATARQPQSEHDGAGIDSSHAHRTPFSILTCTQFAVGSNGSIEVEYSKGGRPVVLVPDDLLDNSGLCGHELATTVAGKSSQGAVTTSGASKAPLMNAFVAGLVLVISSLLVSAL